MVRLLIHLPPCLLDLGRPDVFSATYAAFCRHYGKHVTRATEVCRCWNDEAMQAMVTHMRLPWQDFRRNALQLQEGVFETIDDIFGRAIAQCM